MRLERLRTLLERQGPLKIFVVGDDFCLCGYARTAREREGTLEVTLGASLRISFDTLEWTHEPVVSPTLRLSSDHRVTRRLQTHRRQLDGLDVPARYFDAAKTF